MSDLAFIFGTGRLHFIAVNDFKDTILAGRTSEVFGKTFFQPFHVALAILANPAKDRSLHRVLILESSDQSCESRSLKCLLV